MCSFRNRGFLALILALLLLLTGPAIASDADHVLKLYATEFALVPSITGVVPGAARILVINEGVYPHGFEIEGVEGSRLGIEPGQTEQIIVPLSEGTYVFYCPNSDHRRRGMEGRLNVDKDQKL